MVSGSLESAHLAVKRERMKKKRRNSKVSSCLVFLLLLASENTGQNTVCSSVFVLANDSYDYS